MFSFSNMIIPPKDEMDGHNHILSKQIAFNLQESKQTPVPISWRFISYYEYSYEMENGLFILMKEHSI